MRLVLRGSESERVVLPTDYNYLVQAAIYRSISRELADFLHDRGFLFGKRSFKMFTFSRLEGRYVLDRDNGRFIYSGDVTLYVSSPIEKFIEDLANTIALRGSITLGKQRLKVVELAFPPRPAIEGDKLVIRMLSPLTVYSTLMTRDGRRKTYYFSPYEREFSELVNSNIKRKHFLLTGRRIKSDIRIEPLKVREVIVMYKGTVVKGWMGLFSLSGPKTLIETAYEVGLGAKNSQGFGMFEIAQHPSTKSIKLGKN